MLKTSVTKIDELMQDVNLLDDYIILHRVSIWENDHHKKFFKYDNDPYVYEFKDIYNKENTVSEIVEMFSLVPDFNNWWTLMLTYKK